MTRLRKSRGLAAIALTAVAVAAPPPDLEPRPEVENPTRWNRRDRDWDRLPYVRGEPRLPAHPRPPPPEYAYWYYRAERAARRRGEADPWGGLGKDLQGRWRLPPGETLGRWLRRTACDWGLPERPAPRAVRDERARGPEGARRAPDARARRPAPRPGEVYEVHVPWCERAPAPRCPDGRPVGEARRAGSGGTLEGIARPGSHPLAASARAGDIAVGHRVAPLPELGSAPGSPAVVRDAAGPRRVGAAPDPAALARGGLAAPGVRAGGIGGGIGGGLRSGSGGGPGATGLVGVTTPGRILQAGGGAFFGLSAAIQAALSSGAGPGGATANLSALIAGVVRQAFDALRGGGRPAGAAVDRRLPPEVEREVYGTAARPVAEPACADLAPWETPETRRRAEGASAEAAATAGGSGPRPPPPSADRMAAAGETLLRRRPNACARSCLECHRGPCGKLSGLFARFPAYHGGVNRIIGIEEQVNLCRSKQGAPRIPPDSNRMAAILMALRARE